MAGGLGGLKYLAKLVCRFVNSPQLVKNIFRSLVRGYWPLKKILGKGWSLSTPNTLVHVRH